MDTEFSSQKPLEHENIVADSAPDALIRTHSAFEGTQVIDFAYPQQDVDSERDGSIGSDSLSQTSDLSACGSSPPSPALRAPSTPSTSPPSTPRAIASPSSTDLLKAAPSLPSPPAPIVESIQKTHSTPANSSSKLFTLQQLNILRYSLDIAPLACRDNSDSTETVSDDLYVNLLEDVIFIAVDCEAWEQDRKTVTEVGIASLDTRDLQDQDPGLDGQGYLSKIKYRHIIVEGTEQLVNKIGIDGCPFDFNFGKSECLPLAKIPTALDDNFNMRDNEDQTDDQPKYRKVVLVGHSLNEDIKYLGLVDFDVVTRTKNLVGRIDTLTLGHALDMGFSVGKMAHLLGIKTSNLHNAGNDSAYTLHNLIMLALRAGESFPIPKYWPRELLNLRQRWKQDEKQEKERKERTLPVRIAHAAAALMVRSPSVAVQLWYNPRSAIKSGVKGLCDIIWHKPSAASEAVRPSTELEEDESDLAPSSPTSESSGTSANSEPQQTTESLKSDDQLNSTQQADPEAKQKKPKTDAQRAAIARRHKNKKIRERDAKNTEGSSGSDTTEAQTFGTPSDPEWFTIHGSNGIYAAALARRLADAQSASAPNEASVVCDPQEEAVLKATDLKILLALAFGYVVYQVLVAGLFPEHRLLQSDGWSKTATMVPEKAFVAGGTLIVAITSYFLFSDRKVGKALPR